MDAKRMKLQRANDLNGLSIVAAEDGTWLEPIGCLHLWEILQIPGVFSGHIEPRHKWNIKKWHDMTFCSPDTIEFFQLFGWSRTASRCKKWELDKSAFVCVLRVHLSELVGVRLPLQQRHGMVPQPYLNFFLGLGPEANQFSRSSWVKVPRYDSFCFNAFGSACVQHLQLQTNAATCCKNVRLHPKTLFRLISMLGRFSFEGYVLSIGFFRFLTIRLFGFLPKHVFYMNNLFFCRLFIWLAFFLLVVLMKKIRFFFRLFLWTTDFFNQQPQRYAACCEYNCKQKLEKYENSSQKKTNVT